MIKPGLSDQEKPSNAHVAFSVGSKERLDALTNELSSARYEVVSGLRTTSDGYYESCVVVIEGNQVTVQSKGTKRAGLCRM